MGQLINTAVGGANLYAAKQCFSTCGAGGGGCCSMAPVFLLMGIQSLAQAKEQGKTAGEAGGSFSLTDASGMGGGYDPEAVKKLENDPQLKQGMDFVSTAAALDAQKDGFSYDPKTGTVTMADGKKLKPSDVSSTGSMQSAGLSQGIIDSASSMEKRIIEGAMKKIDKLGLKAMLASSGEESSGGGGGSGSSSSSNGNADYAGYGAAQTGSGLGVDRDPAQVAGMQKNYNGEPIGVSADSIFKMMNRRYKVKESQSSFLDEAELPFQK